MAINVAEITSVLKHEIAGLRAAAPGQRGRHRHRSRRRHRPHLRPAQRHGRRTARVRERHDGPGLQPRRRLDRRGHLRQLPRASRKATPSRPPAACSKCPSATRSSAAWSTRWASRSTAGPPIASTETPQDGHRRPRHRRAPAGERAAADRHQGDRRDDPDRPRPARADHRRPQDRQDRHRHRHDHQPEGQGREVLLRRDRLRRNRPSPASSRCCEPHGAMEYTTVVVATAADPAPLQYIAPYAGCAMAEYFMWKGEAHAVRLRRSLQAGRRVSPALAAAAPPAGPRGVSPATCSIFHSRLLERAVKLSRRERRRLAHRPADHRNAGRRSVGLHPDQRHQHHRRPDLPRARPVLRRRPPGHQRRHQRQPRGRQRPDQGDEEDRRLAASSTWPPIASSKRSPSSAPNSTRPRRRSSIAAPAWSSCSSSRSTSRCPSSRKSWSSTPAPKGYLDDVPVNRVAGVPDRSSSATSTPATAASAKRLGAEEGADRRLRGPAQAGPDRLQEHGLEEVTCVARRIPARWAGIRGRRCPISVLCIGVSLG